MKIVNKISLLLLVLKADNLFLLFDKSSQIFIISCLEDKLHIVKLMPSLNKHKTAQSIISHARLFEDKHVQISSTLSVNVTPQIPQPRQKISLRIKMKL